VIIETKPLADQVALVTGGGTGIGRAFTEALARAGARVIIASRRQNVLNETAAQINQSAGAERVPAYAFDIRQLDQIDSLVGDVIDRFGAIDVLINNSGLAVPETVDQISEAGWDEVLDTNLRGVMQLVRAVLPHMVKMISATS